MTVKIHRNDTVQVISGSDRGKRGRVLRVDADSRVLVEHVHMIKQRNIKGGIAEQEAPVNLSNVLLVCSNCGKATRAGFKIENGVKERVCGKCGAEIVAKKK
jgi:large subunit ribosomal protein L24